MSGSSAFPNGAKSKILAADSPSIDSFGRWRVSSPATIFDSKNIFDDPGLASNVENSPLFFDNAETSGAGTSTSYRANESSQRLSVGATTAGIRVRRTRQRFNYSPGKSQEILITFNMISQDTGVTKRAGYFDANNGLFLELDGSDAYLVRRTSTSGSPVNNSIAQSSWNIDPLDGTGPSGITLDFTKTQILFIDFEWLGVGRVRMGFVIDGLVYYAHQFLNTNNLTTVYMQTPNLPICWEIENDGTGAASDLDTICCSVMSEGGVEPTGQVRSAQQTTACNANVAGTYYATIAIRLKSAYIGQSIEILQANLIEITGSDNLVWDLRFNPTLGSALSYSDVDQSAIQVAYGDTANTVTGGHSIAGGFFASANGGTAGTTATAIDNAIKLGNAIDGTPDEIVLCVSPLPGSSNADVFGSFTWRELS